LNIFFQQVLNGLTLGSVYALVALGLTLVYGILHIPNFAHGALYMVGAYIAFYLVGSLGANYWSRWQERRSWWLCSRCCRIALSFID